MTRAEDVAGQIQRSILQGTWQPGERLPPERALAEQLGASRVSVRGALALLTGQGLLSVRQGQGYTVRDFRLHGSAALLPALIEVRDDAWAIIGDLQRLRRHLAVAALELIAERRPDPAPLAQAIDRMAAVVGDGPQAVAAADLDVTRAMLALTGSVALQVSINPIITLLLQQPAFVANRYDDPDSNVAGWRSLLAWAADPSPDLIPLIVAALAERDALIMEHIR